MPAKTDVKKYDSCLVIGAGVVLVTRRRMNVQ